MSRLFCICSVLLPVFAGAVFGEGTYQRTKDGKTMVWNNDPKPGDAAAWCGDRDGEGYATGFGTLSWYITRQQQDGHTESTLSARYFGRMVRGKFDGPVNAHSKGKTDHAIFVDGQRTTRWAAGPAPSWRVAQSQARRPAKPAVAAEPASIGPFGVAEALAEGPPTTRSRGTTTRQAPNSESFPEQAAQRPIEDTPAKELSEQRAPPANPAVAAEPPSARPSGVAEPEAPAEGPRVVQPESALATASSSPGEQPATPSSESFPEQAAQPQVEETPAKELSEQRARPANPVVTAEPASAVAKPEAPAEGPRVVQTENALAPASSSPGEQPATPSSEGFRGEAAQPPIEDTPSRLVQPPKESVLTPPTSAKSEAEVEDSLQSLAQPPSSLLATPETAGSPEASPHLTKREVINIANAKARTHGYNRTDYHRAEPQYNAAYKVWSVSYEQRAADGMEEPGKHFSVIVDDKTKGTVFLLRR